MFMARCKQEYRQPDTKGTYKVSMHTIHIQLKNTHKLCIIPTVRSLIHYIFLNGVDAIRLLETIEQWQFHIHFR